MKKLMMAAAVAAFCAGANAATLEWGMNNAFAAGSGLTDGTLYLVHGNSVADISTWAAAQTSFAIGTVLAATGGELANINTTSSAPLTKIANSLVIEDGTAAATGIAAKSYGDTPSTGNYYVYLVAISEDGKTMGVTMETTRLSLKNNDTSAAATYGAADFTTYKAADVPEPTSAMLLLLGVAGLALKRKRA